MHDLHASAQPRAPRRTTCWNRRGSLKALWRRMKTLQAGARRAAEILTGARHWMEPTPRLELGTYGLRIGPGPDPEGSGGSRSVTLQGVTASATSPRVPTHPANHGQVAALVLHGSGTLISPTEAALRLGIKRCTVYSLCAKGELPHLRVGSLLRIDVDGFLAAQRAGRRDKRR